jgi:hypothetical protein
MKYLELCFDKDGNNITVERKNFFSVLFTLHLKQEMLSSGGSCVVSVVMVRNCFYFHLPSAA